jgi:hypothetical protein
MFDFMSLNKNNSLPTLLFYYSLKCQLTAFLPFLINKSFAFEKHFDLKNLLNESGDGCADLIIPCLVASINFSFLCAKLPHNIKTQYEFFSAINLMTVSVKVSQPILACDPGVCSLEIS